MKDENQSNKIIQGFISAPWMDTVLIIFFLFGITLSFVGTFKDMLHIDVDSYMIFGLTIFLPTLVYGLRIHIGLSKNNSLIPNIIQDIASIKSSIAPIGVFKKITDTNIWKFEEEIWGWNPNWAIELNSTDNNLKNGLNKIHLDRIIDPNIKSINYIFLEGYKLKNNGYSTDMEFGSDKFCNYLTRIAFESKYRKTISEKYNIWKIPYDDWKRDGNFNQFIKYYRDFIVIAGKKGNHIAATIFMNYPGFFDDTTGHLFYLEIQDNETIKLVTKLKKFIVTLSHKLDSEGIKPQKVIFNKHCNQYEIT